MRTKKIFFKAILAITVMFSVYSCMISSGTGLGIVSTTTTTTTTVLLWRNIWFQQHRQESSVMNIVPKITGFWMWEKWARNKGCLLRIWGSTRLHQLCKIQSKEEKNQKYWVTIAFRQYPNNPNFYSRLQGTQTVYLKATVKPLGSGKVEMGGSHHVENEHGFEDVNTFDFRQLTPL